MCKEFGKEITKLRKSGCGVWLRIGCEENDFDIAQVERGVVERDVTGRVLWLFSGRLFGEGSVGVFVRISLW